MNIGSQGGGRGCLISSSCLLDQYCRQGLIVHEGTESSLSQQLRHDPNTDPEDQAHEKGQIEDVERREGTRWHAVKQAGLQRPWSVTAMGYSDMVHPDRPGQEYLDAVQVMATERDRSCMKSPSVSPYNFTQPPE
ncbi:hypothetical protein PG996_014703 [Apiospora saccharicola]|uniref:Uncharacterized protein n=1 Tax=Apiospora saccharicola TaxID=335842 RepID=A0ABR1TLP9_9PEZI